MVVNMKRSSRIKYQYNNYILILSLISQLIFITASSPVNYSVGQTSIYEAAIIRTLQFPYKNNQIRYYLSSFNEEPTADIGPKDYTWRRTIGSKVFVHYYIRMFPYIGLGVIMLCFGHVISRKTRRKAVLAYNLGGHAPPLRMRLDYINI